MTIVEFLRARLDEDEQVAHESNDHPSAGDFPLYVVDDDYKYDTICISAGRVLAEVAAKRRIVDLHAHRDGPHECPEWKWRDPEHPEDPWETQTGWTAACLTLGLLALPYADHPSYRSEWAP